MFNSHFGGFTMGAPVFLFRLHDKGPVVLMPGHSVGQGKRSVLRPKIHGFSGAALREMRRVNGVGSSHRRKRAQARQAALAKRRAASKAKAA